MYHVHWRGVHKVAPGSYSITTMNLTLYSLQQSSIPQLVALGDDLSADGRVCSVHQHMRGGLQYYGISLQNWSLSICRTLAHDDKRKAMKQCNQTNHSIMKTVENNFKYGIFGRVGTANDSHKNAVGSAYEFKHEPTTELPLKPLGKSYLYSSVVVVWIHDHCTAEGCFRTTTNCGDGVNRLPQNINFALTFVHSLLQVKILSHTCVNMLV